LADAKRAYEEAIQTYEKFKRDFVESNTTGKWLNSLLVPETPLPKTREARLPLTLYNQLLGELKEGSLYPGGEEITESPHFKTRFDGHSRITMSLEFKVGINPNKFNEICRKLGFWPEIRVGGYKIISASVSYGDYNPKYRQDDIQRIERYKGFNNKKVGNYWVPQSINQSLKDELVNKYFEEQMAAYDSVKGV